MKNIITFLLIIFFYPIGYAQNCPPGYSERDVKCHGEITKQCVPDKHNCKDCWTVEWQNCDGNWNHIGGSAEHPSYEKCMEDAERTKNGNLYHRCPEMMNKYVYRIYLTDGQFCNGNTKSISNTDFKSKFASLFGSWSTSVADAYERYKGYSGPVNLLPELTSVITDYLGVLQDGMKLSNKVKEYSNDLVNKNTSEIDRQLTVFQNEYSDYQRATSSFQSKLQTTISNNPSWKRLPDGTYYKIL